MTYTSFRPGQVWLDSNGSRIQAHSGAIFYEAGTYYWYGENKEHTRPNNGIKSWGVRCYSSRDLYNWEDLGLIIQPDQEDPTSPLHPGRQLDRPHIIHNRLTGKYVCWIKVMGGSVQLSTVLTADSLLGPYEIQHRDFRPLGMNAGDFDLVAHPSDDKAYYYFERVHSELICADLDAGYIDVTGYYSTHFPLSRPPFVREAPSFFTRNDLHYLITSGTTGYYPNPSEVAVASTYHGPWRRLGDPHPGDSSRTSYRTQISSVFKHPEKRDLYIAIADRWVPGLGAESSNFEEEFERMFASGGGEDLTELPPVDTSIADYVWLPIRFDQDLPVIDWRDEWSIEEFS